MPDGLPQRVSGYEILREIGRGGMGVVYLARDTKLERDVAIKVLPENVAQDPERMRRFEREAKLLASLKHPNIATVHGLEQSDGQHFLVLEYVEGQTLEEVLEQGPMPVSEALPVARQIAEAIEAAHDGGVIHRDLKPANIKFTVDDKVKVLDFGLAKAFEDPTTMASDLAASPTYVATSPSIPGAVLGTAGYLSPEQARARPVDKRSDIFSFGCVLYEMLVGGQLFGGDTVADVVGATLHKEPEWGSLPPDTPPTIRLLLRRCLAKDRIDEAIADPTSSSLDLASAALAASSPATGRRRSPSVAAGFVIGAALAVAATLAAVRLLAPTPPPEPLRRLSIVLPIDSSGIIPFLPALAVAPDGEALVYRAFNAENERQLFLRSFDQPEPTVLAGTTGVWLATFSPDGQWIAFGDGDSLMKVSVRGGPAVKLHSVRRCSGLSWGTDGQIYFSSFSDSALRRISENGGAAETIEGTQGAQWPHALPGGRGVLYALPEDDETVAIHVLDLAAGGSRRLVEDGSFPIYSESGHLLFLRDSTLMAVAFDVETLSTRGQPVPLPERVPQRPPMGCASLGLTRDGELCYIVGHSGEEAGAELAILDLQGRRTPLLTGAGEYNDPEVTPDGRFVVYTETDQRDELGGSIWLFDIERKTRSLLTPEEGNQFEPLISADGKWVYYSAARRPDGFLGIFRRRIDGAGSPELVFETSRAGEIQGITADGTVAILEEYGSEGHSPGTRGDLSLLRLGDEVVKEPWLNGPHREHDAALAPNGRWVAYVSDVSGEPLLYVRPLDLDGGQYLVASERANDPVWSPDGKTLYFETMGAGRGRIMAATVTSGAGEDEEEPFECDVPRVLFEMSGRRFDHGMLPDGKGIIIAGTPADDSGERAEIRVVQNLFGELERLAPTE
ncbi:MAG: protein kinase domain-containing protein [Planctomycetota bacterium]